MKSFSESTISKKGLMILAVLLIAGVLASCTYFSDLDSVASILDSNKDYHSREVTFSSTEGTDTIIEFVNRTKETGMASDYRNVRFLDSNNNIIPQDRNFDSNSSTIRLQLDTTEGLTTIKEQWCDSWEITDADLKEEMVENSRFTQDTDWTIVPTGTFASATSIIAHDKFDISLNVESDSATVYAVQTTDLTNVDELTVNYGITQLSTTENADGKLLILIDDVEKSSIDTVSSTTQIIDVSAYEDGSTIKAVCSGTANSGTVDIEGYFNIISAPSTAEPTVIEVTPTYKTIELVEATLETASVTTETTVETTTEVVTTTNTTATTTTSSSTTNLPTVHQYYPDSDDLPIAEKIYTWVCSTLNLDIPHGEIVTAIGDSDKIIVHLNESKKCDWYLNDNITSTITSNVPSIDLTSTSVGENTVKLTIHNGDDTTETHKWDWNIQTTSENTSN